MWRTFLPPGFDPHRTLQEDDVIVDTFSEKPRAKDEPGEAASYVESVRGIHSA